MLQYNLKIIINEIHITQCTQQWTTIQFGVFNYPDLHRHIVLIDDINLCHLKGYVSTLVTRIWFLLK